MDFDLFKIRKKLVSVFKEQEELNVIRQKK